MSATLLQTTLFAALMVLMQCPAVQIIETLEVFEIVWNIPLNNGHSKIKKSDRYLKNSEVCELPRRDGRQGVLRSQINFTPEGHVHIRSKPAHFSSTSVSVCNQF